jgi:small subunit ribosomal protein S16
VAVRIRLRRIGKKKQPQYRLIVADSVAPRDGRFIETIGQYNPRVEPALVSVNEERALWWLRQGARPSDTALSLLKKSGVWEQFTGEPTPAPATQAIVAAPEPAAPPEMEDAASSAEAGEEEDAASSAEASEEEGEASSAEASEEGEDTSESEQTPK